MDMNAFRAMGLRMKMRAAAAELAVCYCAYIQANNRSDDEALMAWGPMLIKAQSDAGVELYTGAQIDAHMRSIRICRSIQ